MESSPSSRDCKVCPADISDLMNKYAPGNTLFSKPAILERRSDCPLSYEELGHCGWGILHTMAAYYPDQPTHIEKVRMREFLERFAMFYPCGVCGDHMSSDISSNPPDTASRAGLSLWMCQMHNRVNSRLGKPQFDCSLVAQRWRDGWRDGSCD
jgi:mitochondrial FAD-linked sulfhydryl oxidase